MSSKKESKSFLASNLKLLRTRRKRSQEETSRVIGATRSAYSSYETGVAEPALENLVKLAEYFQISLDKLVKTDLSRIPEKELSQLEKGFDVDLSGVKLRVLATTVNAENEENTELVPVNAKAGYTTGYADPEFIRVLPAFNLPFLSPNRKYRAFPISGDSMPPVDDGAFVTGEYVQNWNLVRNGFPYIIVTRNEGIVFKVVYNRIHSNGTLLLCSTNPEYEPYEVPVKDVLEIWKFVNYINHSFKEVNTPREPINQAVLTMQRDIAELRSAMQKLEKR